LQKETSLGSWKGHHFPLGVFPVDGRNPKTSQKVPGFIGFYTSQVVQDFFFHQQYDLEDSVNSSLIGVPQSLLRTLSRRLSLPALGMRKHHWAEPSAWLD